MTSAIPFANWISGGIDDDLKWNAPQGFVGTA
jgi:hypothetical protein